MHVFHQAASDDMPVSKSLIYWPDISMADNKHLKLVDKVERMLFVYFQFKGLQHQVNAEGY